MRLRRFRFGYMEWITGAAAALLTTCAAAVFGQSNPSEPPRAADVPTAATIIGWEPGTDRKLVDSAQVYTYFQKLDAASDRIRVVEIGESVGGHPLQMAIISSEENMRQLERYRDISRRLALARGLTDDEAQQLATDGKAVVWIDHGLHATETAHVEAAILLADRLVAGEDADARRIRQNAIVLLLPLLNPDGRERVLAWYKRNLGTSFEMTPLPYLDHPYVGHENNRDGFMTSTPEVRAMAKVMWEEWIPQIVVNHHQGAPFPSRMFVPPYQEPLNPNLHRLVLRGINTVGSIMAQRFDREGKTGVISRASYTLWANGPVRATGCFHNQIGILTEVQTRPALWASPGFTEPDSLPNVFGTAALPAGMTPREPSIFYPRPWQGGSWTFRDQVDYSVTASMGAADAAARFADEWLYNIYLMGKEAIEQGEAGEPYAYVINPNQWDGSEAIELVNLLRRGAIEVQRATTPFTAGGRSYPAGTYIAHTSQAFRAHLVDIMEAQRHPDLRQYPGGPPIPPYDGAAWTVPMGMGVTADRIDEPFKVTANPVTDQVVRPGALRGRADAFLMTSAENASFRAINQFWEDGAEISRTITTFTASDEQWPAGTFVVRGDTAKLEAAAKSLGVELVAAGRLPVQVPLARPRVGLYQSDVVHGHHNPDEGWTRWIFEQYGINYKTLKDADVRAGGTTLSEYNVIVLPDQEQLGDILKGHAPGTMPPEFTGGLGVQGTANLKRFVEDGGTLVALDQASHYVMQEFGIPLTNAAEGVSKNELFIPGSFVRIEVDNTNPVAFGMPPVAAAMYYRRRGGEHMVFSAVKGASTDTQQTTQQVDVVARFAGKQLLMSGWEVGADRYLAGTPAVVRLRLGTGSIVLINFRAQFRNQVRGTFKLLFNSLMLPPMPVEPSTTAR
jgi:hypothetical protein